MSGDWSPPSGRLGSGPPTPTARSSPSMSCFRPCSLPVYLLPCQRALPHLVRRDLKRPACISPVSRPVLMQIQRVASSLFFLFRPFLVHLFHTQFAALPFHKQRTWPPRSACVRPQESPVLALGPCRCVCICPVYICRTACIPPAPQLVATA